MDAPEYFDNLEEIISKTPKESGDIPQWMVELPTERTITVASVKPSEYAASQFSREAAYIIKHEYGLGWEIWFRNNLIKGFDDIYEEGYEYELQLRILYVNDEPKDGLNRRYELININSKVKKDSEGIPEWMTKDEK